MSEIYRQFAKKYNQRPWLLLESGYGIKLSLWQKANLFLRCRANAIVKRICRLLG